MTDICRHYAKGNCWRGAACGFRHPIEMRRHQYIQPEPPLPPSIDPALVTRGYIKLGCLEFRATRKCAEGRNCFYIHEPVQSIGGFSSAIEEYEREKEKERENEVTLK